MSLGGGQILIAQFKVLYGGKFAYNTLHYAVDGPDTTLDIDEYHGQFGAIAIGSYADCLVDTARVIEVKTWLRGSPNPFETRITNLDYAGTQTGEGMPTFVAAKLRATPDNTSKWPVGAQDFKWGSVAIGGVPESAANGGYFTTAYRALLSALCGDLITVNSTSGFSPVLTLYLDRTEPVKTSTGLARCFVSSLNPWRIGSQNTRKT